MLAHRLEERLRVGIGDDKLDALQVAGDHVVHGIAAGTADTEDRDAWSVFRLPFRREIDGHGVLLYGVR